MKVTKDRAIQRFQQNHPKTKEYDAFVKTQGASLQKKLQKMVDFAMKIPNKKNQAKYIDNEVRDIERELVKNYEKHLQKMKKEEVVLKTFKELREEKKKTAVFTFGRFNPPTIGHEKLIDKVSKVAGSNSYFIYPSHSQNTKKDPLPQSLKIAYMRSMFPKHAKKIIAGTEKNVFDIAVSLYNKGFTDIEMVVGSDRIREFHKILSKYNGLQGRHGFYDFKTVTVTSAGDRDPDADGVKGMSASKMRGAALSNDFETFKSGLPKTFGHAQKMFKDIRKYMKVIESFNTISPTLTEEDVIRDMYLENKIFNIGDIVEDSYTGVSGEIIRRGTNYLVFAEEDGTTHKKWLFEIKLKEDCWPGFKQIGMKMKNGKRVPNCVPVGERNVKQDKDVKDKKGTQPAKYFAKDADGDEMSKSTKDKRDAHFKKGASKSDDDPSAYKPAPGDKGAKTKLSKYTKAMRKKYPDLYKEEPRIPRKKGQPANSDKHSDLYTDENPKGTIHGLKFATVQDAKDSVEKIESSGKTHAHKIQAAIAMEQRARVMGKTAEANVYRAYIDKMKKKTKEMQKEDVNESADASLRKKAEKSGISFSILKKVYNRGVAAWRTGHRPGTTPQQWGHARVNSFMTGGKTRTTGDADLWKQHKGKSEQVKIMKFSEAIKCPPATQNLKINTKNRDATIKNYNYGPLNVDEPGDYWEKIAKYWKTTEDAAKKSLCGNCVAFDISPRMDDCMPGKTSDDDGRLGYCWMHHFKCHSARSCHTWAKGGPIKTDEKSNDWQDRAKMDEKAPNTADAMKRYKSGKAGFTDVAHLKAKGLIKRSDGTKRKSDKYEYSGAGEWGTDKLANKYKKDTPGQSVKSFTEFRTSCCEDCEQESDLIESNIYRVGSQKYFEYFLEKKKLYKENKLKVDNKFDIELLEGDIGEYAEYEGKNVALDTPMFEEDDVELNKPKRGGPKKYYVYVKDPSTGNVKKVTWGDTTGLKVKLNDPEARKSFAARHKCDTRTDKTKASYWACRLPKYAKQLGLSGGGNFFW